MALGVPVIAADTKIDRFYFDDSVVKFFLSEDPTDLARSIVSLRENDTARNELINNGLKFARQHSWDQRQREYCHLVDELVGATGLFKQKKTLERS